LHLTYQYRLSPTKSQLRALDRILEMQRLLYNAALQERRDAWRLAKVSIGWIDQSKALTTIRSDDPDGYGALPANLSRWTFRKVDFAFQEFFKRVKVRKERAGFPRFRGARWCSFGFAEFSGIQLVEGHLLFKGMPGKLEVRFHRPLPDGARICSCVLTRDLKGWCVSFQMELPDVHTVRREAGELVGIDWGVEHLATLSNGEHVENPRFGAAAAPAIRCAQRKLARAKRGSKGREKAKLHLLRQRRKLANRRKAYLHQVSARLARRFGSIAVEDLQVKNLTASAKGDAANPGTNVRQKAGLNREILDTAPGTLIAMLRYKAERASGRFAAVDARHTSQSCSGCGATVLKDLNERVHKCRNCEEEVHRDVNAARNILQRAVVGPWSGNRPNDLAGDRRSVIGLNIAA
jgi:putative transposase